MHTSKCCGYAASSWNRLEWRTLSVLPDAAPAATLAPVVREQSLPLPRRGELILNRARTLAASGHLSDALTTLDLIRSTDAQKADANRLRADIQRQLLALTAVPGPLPPAEPEKADRRVP